jgi:predicted phosphatase
LNKLSFNIVSDLTFEKESEESKELIKNTILEKYNTIIFDIDGVLLDCFTPEGKGIGAFQTTPPFKLQDKNTVIDIKDNIIKLQEGIKDLIDMLDYNSKNLGIVSRSSDRSKQVPAAAQPAVMLLKIFDIFKYFNYGVTIKSDIEKVNYVKPLGKTLFVDDEKQWVENVNQREDIDVLWRKSFNKWKDLLIKLY